ncbi:hypothetical protein [Paraburkholderia mimosarum]|uniref:hypothetical protein n=1 Tax=Paraburkholderia mimosarum TaxID=312026 RepID=UPI0003F57AEB|nr:hypothetical protein [Paraburkholderia mimosarum]
MKTKLIVVLFAVLSASVAAPAFASGYGPAPGYRPSIGAPESQRGQSLQTLAASTSGNNGAQGARAAQAAQATQATEAAYGGVAGLRSESGGPFIGQRDTLFAHH